MKVLFTLMITLFLASCSLGGRSTIRPLDPPFRPTAPANAPQAYKQGWEDGCETGFGGHGYDVYRFAYSFKQDPSQIMDPVYYKAWKDAENFCRTYILEYSFRALVPWCSLDGITDDCSDNTSYNSAPFIGQSTESLGYSWLGGGGVGASLGGGDKGIDGLMGIDDGMSDFLGWGSLPGVAGGL